MSGGSSDPIQTLANDVTRDLDALIAGMRLWCDRIPAVPEHIDDTCDFTELVPIQYLRADGVMASCAVDGKARISALLAHRGHVVNPDTQPTEAWNKACLKYLEFLDEFEREQNNVCKLLGQQYLSLQKMPISAAQKTYLESTCEEYYKFQELRHTLDYPDDIKPYIF